MVVHPNHKPSLTTHPPPHTQTHNSVKERVERRFAQAQEEGNALFPGLGDGLEGVWERLQPQCTWEYIYV